VDAHGKIRKVRSSLGKIIGRPAELVPQYPVNLREQRAGDRQPENPGASGVEKLKRSAGEDQGGNLDVRVGGDIQRHLMSLAAFLPGFSNQPGKIGLGETELTGAGLAAFHQPTPAPILQVNLERLTHQVARFALVFVGCRGYLRDQARRNEGIDYGLGFHASSLASPPEQFK